MTDSLLFRLRLVALKRQAIERTSAAMAEMIAEVKRSDCYQSYELTRADLAAELADLEEETKALALDLYSHDQKKTRPGVTIKSITTRSFEYDYQAARKWANDHAPELVILDVKLFEAHAKAVAKTAPVPCVKIIETVEDKAQIASDLSAFLV